MANKNRWEFKRQAHIRGKAFLALVTWGMSDLRAVDWGQRVYEGVYEEGK